jgi:hypothetical protein
MGIRSFPGSWTLSNKKKKKSGLFPFPLCKLDQLDRACFDIDDLQLYAMVNSRPILVLYARNPIDSSEVRAIDAQALFLSYEAVSPRPAVSTEQNYVLYILRTLY